MEITSLDNQYVKKVVALHKKKYRDEYKSFFIEGMKTIKEAIEYDCEIENIFYCPDMVEYNLDLEGCKVTREIIAKMSDTSTPQGIIAICKIKEKTLKNKQRLLYLDRVQDPGNVGTIIRTADAFGFDGVLLSSGCADVYSPKVVRSTMGSLFHLPIIQDVPIEKIKELGNKVYSSDLSTNRYLEDLTIEEPFVLVIGNEGQGISEEIRKITDEFVKIKMDGNAESLNASIAAGILIYEFSKNK